MLNAKQFTSLYSEYMESGLTVRDFCINHSMRESKFYYWQKRLKRQLPPRKGFVPVVFENGQQTQSFHFPAPVQDLPKNSPHPQAADNLVCCEISYPSGVCLKLTGLPDTEMLRSLLLITPR